MLYMEDLKKLLVSIMNPPKVPGNFTMSPSTAACPSEQRFELNGKVVPFHNFDILLKALLQKGRLPWKGTDLVKLPAILGGFKMLTRSLFKSSIYNLKCLLKRCGGDGRLCGGLEHVVAQAESGALGREGALSGLKQPTYLPGFSDDKGDVFQK